MTKQLLIVDDEECILELVEACLSDIGGWTIITASCGEEALKIAHNQPLDGILLDVSMPEMDGFAVYEQLQTNSATKTIPVIFLTAKSQTSDRLRFAHMGIAGVIIKPFEPMTISQEVADIFGWDE